MEDAPRFVECFVADSRLLESSRESSRTGGEGLRKLFDVVRTPVVPVRWEQSRSNRGYDLFPCAIEWALLCKPGQGVFGASTSVSFAGTGSDRLRICSLHFTGISDAHT